MKIEKRAIGELKAADVNPRIHGKAQLAGIADSISRFGWIVPILIDGGGNIIAGHGRVAAAESIGIATAPCVVVDDWDAEKKKAYLLADNRLSEMSDWGEEGLRREITYLKECGIEIHGLDIQFDEGIAVPPSSIVSGEDLSGAQRKQDDLSENLETPFIHSIDCPECGKSFEVK